MPPSGRCICVFHQPFPSSIMHLLWEEMLSCSSRGTDRTFCKSVNVGAGWSAAGREGRSVLGADTNLRLILAPPWWKGSSVIYPQPSLWHCPLGEQCHFRVLVLISCQIWQEPDLLQSFEPFPQQSKSYVWGDLLVKVWGLQIRWGRCWEARGLSRSRRPRIHSQRRFLFGNSENSACGENTPIYRDFSPSVLRGEGESGVRMTFGWIGLPICKGNSGKSPVKINISHHS